MPDLTKPDEKSAPSVAADCWHISVSRVGVKSLAQSIPFRLYALMNEWKQEVDSATEVGTPAVRPSQTARPPQTCRQIQTRFGSETVQKCQKWQKSAPPREKWFGIFATKILNAFPEQKVPRSSYGFFHTILKKFLANSRGGPSCLTLFCDFLDDFGKNIRF